MTGDFMSLDDVDVGGKTVIIRVDMNSPYDVKTGEIADSARIRAHAKTIRELSDKKAKVVVLGHQGRKGQPDFVSLRQHAELLSGHVGRSVMFVPDVVGDGALDRMRSLNAGEILVLDNVRSLDEETLKLSAEKHAESQLVQRLAPLADVFVNDAFSVAHRSHASVVGFTTVLPSAAGRVMEREVKAVQRAWDPSGGNTFILGGAKPDDCLGIATHILENVPTAIERVLSCGVLGQLFLMGQGIDLGEPTTAFFEKKGFTELLPQAKKLLVAHKEKVSVPFDVALDVDGERREAKVEELPAEAEIKDIGAGTAREYAKIVQESNAIVVKGPAGVYEEKGFEVGTRMLLDAVAESRGFSLIGGGDTLTAAERLGIDTSKFSYVSLAGGALITYLSGKTLPAVEALRKAAMRTSMR